MKLSTAWNAWRHGRAEGQPKCGGSRWGFFLPRFGLLSRAVLEPEAVVPGLQYMAVIGEPIEERCRHLGVAGNAGPFAEAQAGGDDDAGQTLWGSSEPVPRPTKLAVHREFKGKSASHAQHHRRRSPPPRRKELLFPIQSTLLHFGIRSARRTSAGPPETCAVLSTRSKR